jgi:hypothetical protein
VQDVGGTQRGDRGGHQITPDRLQRRAVGEQDVAGVFALIDHPPVAGKAGVRDVRQQRIDQGRLALEDRRPVGVGEPLTQRRDGRRIINRNDLVVAALVPDRRRIEPPRQPLVDVDLDLVGVCSRTCIQPNSESIRYR